MTLNSEELSELQFLEDMEELELLESMEAKQPESHDFSASEMVKNIPSSAAGLAKDMYQAVRHPIETGKAVANVAAGGLYKANEALKESLPEYMQFTTKPIRTLWGGENKLLGQDQAPMAEAVGQSLKDRYGGIDETKRTVQEDPVGALADLAGIISGAGVASKMPKISKLGEIIDPINIAGKTISATKSRVPEGLTPSGMYKSAAKFNTSTPSDVRSSITETALKNRIMPTESGLDKLDGLIKGYTGKLDELLKKAQATGQTIPKEELYKYINELSEKKGGVRLGAQADVDTIKKIVDGFDDHLSTIGKDRLDAGDLQNLKLEADKEINWDRRNLRGNLTKEETYQAIRKAAKENIESLEPGVKGVNQELSQLYELQKYLPQKVARVENRDLMSLGAPAKIMAGDAVSPGLGTAIGTGLAITDLPKYKARAAINMRRAADAIQRGQQASRQAMNAELAQSILGSVPGQVTSDIVRLAIENPELARLAAILSGRSTDTIQQVEQQ